MKSRCSTRCPDRLVDGLILAAIVLTSLLVPQRLLSPALFGRSSELLDNFEVVLTESPRLSPYDEIIQQYAQRHNLDWRLVASMISAESRFRKDAVSPAGARGLMQIMPVVAEEQGVLAMHQPRENIRAGVVHFAKNFERLRGATPDDVLKLSLAAYNAGIGHLRDAQRLARKLKMNPRLWEDVSAALLLLENDTYAAEARYGYCKGSEAVEYVDRVLKQFEVYKKLYSSSPVRAA